MPHRLMQYFNEIVLTKNNQIKSSQENLSKNLAVRRSF